MPCSSRLVCASSRRCLHLACHLTLEGFSSAVRVPGALEFGFASAKRRATFLPIRGRRDDPEAECQDEADCADMRASCSLRFSHACVPKGASFPSVSSTNLLTREVQNGRGRLEEYYDRLTKAAHDSFQDGGQKPSSPAGSTLAKVDKDRFRLLLPASNAEINLCKTMMTAHALGYPTPTLIGFNETYDHAGEMRLSSGQRP